MNATPPPAWPTADVWPAPPAWPVPSRMPSRTGRVVALVLGVLLLLPGLGMLSGGGILLWAHHIDRSEGFVVSPQEVFSSAGHALVSDRIDVSAVPEWLQVSGTLGTARLEVTGVGPADVFVGVAASAD